MKGEIRLDQVRLALGGMRFEFDLEIPDGDFVAITGPSGAGKTTLFNLIAGFEEPDLGTIKINGEIVNGRAPAERSVSVVFQEHNLFAHLDIFSNVALGISPSLKLDGGNREQVFQALKRVGLEGFQKRMPESLSGGEKQRVAFARALVRHRPVMLLDEPFAALDPELRADMGQLLKELHHQEKVTILMITHDPFEANTLANTTIRVEKGRIPGAISKS